MISRLRKMASPFRAAYAKNTYAKSVTPQIWRPRILPVIFSAIVVQLRSPQKEKFNEAYRRSLFIFCHRE